MGTKTIRVSEDVYSRLKARKRESESFTDLLDRLVDTDRDLESGYGEWSNVAHELQDVHDELEEELEEAGERSG